MSGLTCGVPPNRDMGGVKNSFNFTNGVERSVRPGRRNAS